jgi:hypothetical protein
MAYTQAVGGPFAGPFVPSPTLGQVGYQPVASVNMHPGTQVVTPGYNGTVFGVPNVRGGYGGFAQTVGGGFNPMVANPYPMVVPGAGTAYGATAGGIQTTLPNAPFPLSGTWPTVPVSPANPIFGDAAPAIGHYSGDAGSQRHGLLRKKTPMATSASRTARTVTPYQSAGPTSLGAVPFNPAHGNYTRYPLGDVKKRYVQQY